MYVLDDVLAQALKHPQLAPPQGCAYVSRTGERCIVGTVLHLVGVDNDTLMAYGNSERIIHRRDLHDVIAESFGAAALTVLQCAQSAWDEPMDLHHRESAPAIVDRYLDWSGFNVEEEC